MSKLTMMQIKLIRMTVWGHVIWNDIHTGHLVFLLPFHSSVLKPYFYLSFCQTQSVCYLDPTPSRQITIEMEFLLQF